MARNKKNIGVDVVVKYNDKAMKKLQKDTKTQKKNFDELANSNEKLGKAMKETEQAVKKIINTNIKSNSSLKAGTAAANTKTSALKRLKNAYDALSTAMATMMAYKVVWKIIDIGKACINLASDMEELDNITRQVFGNMKSEVEIWAKKVGAEMGRSTYQMQKSVSDVANILKGFGDNFNDKQIKEMSENLATLAVDMGSFLNISDERASQAIIGAITGEAEALKRLGFNLQETTIKEYALSKGIQKKYEDMTQAEKAQLRYHKLLELTTHIQGDAARTIDSYANQVKQLGANLSNMGTIIGNALKKDTGNFINGLNTIIDTFNRWATRKTNMEFISDAVTQVSNIKTLIAEYERLYNRLQTLKKGTHEYEVVELRLKKVQTELIEINPAFLNALENNTDRMAALKKVTDDTTISIYKMITAQMKQQNLDDIKGYEGKKLSKVQKKFSESAGDFSSELAYYGATPDSIAKVINNIATSKSLDDALTRTSLTYRAYFDTIGKMNKNDFDIMVKELYSFKVGIEKATNNLIKKYDELDKNTQVFDKMLMARLGISVPQDTAKLEAKENKPEETEFTFTPSVNDTPKSLSNTKINNKWENIRNSLKELENSIDDVKLDKYLNEIQSLNKSVTKKQLEKLEQLTGVLTSDEILSEKVKIYESSINTLKELANGTKDKNKLNEVLNKLKETKELLNKAQEELIEENLIKNLDDEIKKLLKGHSEAVKKKQIEKSNITYDKELNRINELEAKGLITKLEASKKHLELITKQTQILKEYGELNQIEQNLLKQKSLKIQESIEKLKNNIETTNIANSLRAELEKMSKYTIEALDIEQAKKNYQNNLKLLTDTLTNLPKELKDKININGGFKEISRDINHLLNDKSISEEAKKIVEALKNLLENTSRDLEKANAKSTKDKAKEVADKIKKSIDVLNTVAKDFNIEGLSEALQTLNSFVDNFINAIDSYLSGNIFGAITSGIKTLSNVIGAIFGLANKDDGSAKVREEIKKEKEKFNNEIVEVNRRLMDSVINLDQDIKSFNNTLIKNIASNTSNENLFKSQKLADEMAKLYLNAFDTKVKTTIARKAWVDTPWWQFGTTDHWEYHGTETEERSLREILGISEITSVEQLRKIYEENKNKSYSGKFTDRGHEGSFFGTEKYHQKELIGSNYDEAMRMLLVFADNAERNFKKSKKTAELGIMESFDGLEVTSAGELKEKALAQMKRLVEASGQDYSLVANKLEAKLNEIIKDDEVIVSAFNDVRNNIHQNLSAGNDVLDSLANGLQSYFNKIRSNLAKIQYDLQFRGLESGFNEKFKKLAEELTKIRLENKKTLKDLDPKFLNFGHLFKQLKQMQTMSNDLKDIVTKLREQAKKEGIDEELIDKMLPLNKMEDKISKISEMLKNAMTLALDTNSFDQFSMSLGDSIFKYAKEALIQAFAESTQMKELYNQYLNTEEYKNKLNTAKSIKEAYDIISETLNQFENKLKKEGLSFRETNASNGEYLGGMMSRNSGSTNYATVTQGGINITINTTVDNKGYIAVDELTEDITTKVRRNMELALKREV